MNCGETGRTLIMALEHCKDKSGIRDVGQASRSILLVSPCEDAASSRDIDQDGLATAGFNVVAVSSFPLAFEQLHDQRFDAILVNMGLVQRGRIERIAQLESFSPSIPVIVLGNDDNEQLALEILSQGAQDYLDRNRADSKVIARALRFAIERKRVEGEMRGARDQLEARVIRRTAALDVVNKRLQTEIRVRQHTEARLRKERDFIHAVLETVAVSVLVLDREGRVIRINRECCETTGYTLSELKNRLYWQVLFPEAEQEVARTQFNRLIETGKQQNHEGWWLTKSGDKKRVTWSSVILFDDRHQAEFVIVTGNDITEQRRAEELAMERQRDLAHVARLSTMGEMATEIAHELNQPLFAIATFADACLSIYRRQVPGHDDIIDALEEIGKQTARAGRIIQRIRKFVKKGDSRKDAIDLNRIARDVTELIALEASFHEVDIRLDLAGQLPPVLGDSVLLEQVVMNIARNAIEAMDKIAADRRFLTVTTGVDQDHIAFAIADSGPGLSDDELEKVFEAFYSTKQQGMGMGLAIAQSIVEGHDGNLSAHRNSHGGTTFVFRLPILNVEQDYEYFEY